MTRSEIMSRIKGKDTKPEMLVRKALHAAGFRYRLHDKSLPGKPDIVLPSRKTVIFVNGCFWHGHETCYREPKSNKDFWVPKISRNMQRDSEKSEALRHAGWRVVVVWECELKPKAIQGTIDKLISDIK